MARRDPSQPFSLLPALAVVVLGAYVFYNLREVLAPFLLSVALAYLLNPIIDYVETQGLRREAAVIMFYVVVIAGLTVLTRQLAPRVRAEAASLQQNLPRYLTAGERFLAVSQRRVARSFHLNQKEVDAYTAKLLEPALGQIKNLPAVLLGIFPVLSLFFLVPFITFFLLLDWHNTLAGLIQLCPGRYVEQSLHILSDVETSLGNYLRGSIIVALAIGTASFIGLSVMEVEYALGIAALCGVSSFIPYLGAIMGAVVGGAVAGLQFASVTAGLKVVMLFTGIRLADEAFVQPIVSKHAVKLHPLIYLLSLMIGGHVFGFLGVVFAVPFACVLKVLILVAYEWFMTEAYFEASAPLEGHVAPYT